MKAAVLHESGEFAIEERPRPEPDTDEVLVEVSAVGICGSDLHYYEHGRIGDYVVESPLVLGHESAGKVVGVGDDVEDLTDGDRVAIEPGVPCTYCEHCRRGEYNLCGDVTFMATPPDDGALAEYVAWPADFAYRLPSGVSMTEGALCEPLSVGIQVCRRADVGPGDTVAVTGAGPIGQVVLDVARARGASDVIVSDPIEGKRERARKRGADVAIDPAEDDMAEAVREYTDGDADVVVEASGAESAIQSTVDVARRGGAVALVGLGAEPEVSLDTFQVVDKELDLLGSFRYANTYPAAIDLLEDGVVDVEGLVDFEARLEACPDAFERAVDPEIVKGIVTA